MLESVAAPRSPLWPRLRAAARVRLPGKAATLRVLGVAGLVLLGSFLIWGHRWLAGQTIFRGVIQEQYYLVGQYAFDHLIVEEFRAGFFPLWNHLNALGTPLLGNMLSAAFYPLKALTYLFPGDAARDLYIVLRLLIAALLAYALARKLGLSAAAAALAALAFALTGYFKQFVNENYLNADALLPGVVLLTLRLREGGRKADVALLGLLVFAILQNGHPEAAFFTLLLPCCLVAASGRKGLLPAALRLGAAFTLGLVLSLPMLLPFLEYWGRGLNFHAPYTGFFHYPARELAALVSPWFFGAAAPGAPFFHPPAIGWPDDVGGLPAYAATAVPWLCPALGAVPLFLAGVAAARLRTLRRVEVALLAYAIFFLGVMYGLPGFQLLGFAPIFDFSGNFKHPLPAVALATALLAGRGLDDIVSGRGNGSRAAAVLATMFILVLALGVFSKDAAGAAPYLNRRSLAIVAILLGSGGWMAAAAGRPRRKGAGAWVFPALTAGVALAGTLGCLALDGFQQPMRDPRYLDRIDGRTAKLLAEQAGLDRVLFSQELFPPNLNILLGAADLRVMDGVNDRRLVEAINRVNGHTREEGGRYWYREIGYLQPMPDRLDQPLLRLFNLRFAVMDGPLPYNRWLKQLPERADVLAPGPEYVGRARFPLGGGEAPGLLLHPPSRLDLRAGSESGTVFRFVPALMPAAVARETDGVWLEARAADDRVRLLWARYLHPRRIPADGRLGPVELRTRPGAAVSFAALPQGSRAYDQAGLCDLRAGSGDEDFGRGSWEEVSRRGNWLYRNPEALPRIFLVARAEAAAEDAALAALAAGRVNPREVALITDRGPAPAAPARPARGLPGEIESVAYGSQRLTVAVKSWADGWLVVGDLYYPGWRARVDGIETRIRRADYCLRALPVPAGRHTVEMSYQPYSFRLALALSLVTLVGLAPALGWRGRRKAAAESVPPAVGAAEGAEENL